jgi:hypothetical protein
MTVMTVKLKIIATKNGTVAFARDSIDKPDIPEPTNRFTPTGGVINPMAKFTIIIIPK